MLDPVEERRVLAIRVSAVPEAERLLMPSLPMRRSFSPVAIKVLDPAETPLMPTLTVSLAPLATSRLFPYPPYTELREPSATRVLDPAKRGKREPTSVLEVLVGEASRL
jgi:hypothetical protein